MFCRNIGMRYLVKNIVIFDFVAESLHLLRVFLGDFKFFYIYTLS